MKTSRALASVAFIVLLAAGCGNLSITIGSGGGIGAQVLAERTHPLSGSYIAKVKGATCTFYAGTQNAGSDVTDQRGRCFLNNPHAKDYQLRVAGPAGEESSFSFSLNSNYTATLYLMVTGNAPQYGYHWTWERADSWDQLPFNFDGNLGTFDMANQWDAAAGRWKSENGLLAW